MYERPKSRPLDNFELFVLIFSPDDHGPFTHSREGFLGRGEMAIEEKAIRRTTLRP